jgi:hydrogenase expression/formation protein HypE
VCCIAASRWKSYASPLPLRVWVGTPSVGAVASPVRERIACGVEIHCLRGLTRGGLAAALVEIAEAARLDIRMDEDAIPVREDVRGACEIFGFDPLHVANEGRFLCIVPAPERERALEILRSQAASEGSCRIGEVQAGRSGLATLRSKIGATRVIDMPSGEQLPRIC